MKHDPFKADNLDELEKALDHAKKENWSNDSLHRLVDTMTEEQKKTLKDIWTSHLN
jgi:hypothetical protein